MIRLAISPKYLLPTLERCGYVPHPKGHHHGYVKYRGRGERWHAYWYEGNLEIHLDVTIDGKHKVAKTFKMLEEEHKKELVHARSMCREERLRKEMEARPMSRKKLNKLKYAYILPKEKLLEALAKPHDQTQ